MHNFLTKIIEVKRKEVEELKKESRKFREALIEPNGDIAIIAEIKLTSPHIGLLGNKNEVERRVILYEKSGVDAISVVVDKTFFHGDYQLIREIKQDVSLPVLSKDFIIDPAQVFYARVMGADAVLLIAKIVSFDKLIQLVMLVKTLGMEVVVEIDNKKDLQKVLTTDVHFIAVNARNLDDLSLDINRACQLITLIPEDRIALAFSGIKERNDVEKYKIAGAKAVLVGTSFMKAKNIKNFIKELRGL